MVTSALLTVFSVVVTKYIVVKDCVVLTPARIDGLSGLVGVDASRVLVLSSPA